MSGGGLAPLHLLRETAARSPRSVLFAEDAGNTTAQGLVELAEARLEGYRRSGIGPGCRVGAVAWPAASFTADVLALLALDAVVAPLPRQLSDWELGRIEALVATTHLAAPLDWPLLPGTGDVVAGRRLIVGKPPGEAPPGGAARCVGAARASVRPSSHSLSCRGSGTTIASRASTASTSAVNEAAGQATAPTRQPGPIPLRR